jgi:sugar O-acyltransferase (sialic acid O-acetyltransferase NeuD family)
VSARRQVVIFGTGDFARTAEVYLRLDSEFDVVAYTVDAEHIREETLGALPVTPFETLDERYPPSDYAMFVAVGFSGVNRARAAVYARCKERGYELITYVSSKAVCFGELAIGDNCFVFEANVIQPNVQVGDDVILWSGNHVGHDSRIGDHCFIASHAVISGNVAIGDYCFVGVNATVRDGVTVAPECVIGAGALIMRDTERGEVYSVRGTPPAEKRSWDLEL